MTEAERIEKNAPENLLVEMSVTMNNLCRHYDQKDEQGMKFTMQKAYELSHKGIGHLMELDRLTAEHERLQQQLKLYEQHAGDSAEIIVSLGQDLKSAQELNRELAEYLKEILNDYTNHCIFTNFQERTESLINKAK